MVLRASPSDGVSTVTFPFIKAGYGSTAELLPLKVQVRTGVGKKHLFLLMGQASKPRDNCIS